MGKYIFSKCKKITPWLLWRIDLIEDKRLEIDDIDEINQIVDQTYLQVKEKKKTEAKHLKALLKQYERVEYFPEPVPLEIVMLYATPATKKINIIKSEKALGVYPEGWSDLDMWNDMVVNDCPK
jgi:hypothetical protein